MVAVLILVSCSSPLKVAANSTNKEEKEKVLITQIPLRDREKPVVSGKIMVLGDQGYVPVVNTILYLAETIEDTEGVDSFAAMDRVNSPKTITDEDGVFVFEKVPAGKFGLVIDRIVESYLLFQPGTEDPILIAVDDLSVIDLGKLKYDSLPIPVE